MTAKYILDAQGTPQFEPDLIKWAQWFETAERHIAVDQIEDVTVSTVFLGVDHSFSGEDGPVLFETIIFGGPLDQYQWRYKTRIDAVAGHLAAVAKVASDVYRFQTKKG